MKFSRLVAAGIFLSVACHAAISAYFAPDPDQVEIAASEGGAVSVIGSLEDLLAGTDGAPEAVENPPVETQPVDHATELAAVQPTQAVPPKPDLQEATQPVTPTAQPVVEGVTDTAPVTAETVSPQTPRTEPERSAANELMPVVPAVETTPTASEAQSAVAPTPVKQAVVPQTEALSPVRPTQPVMQEAIETKPVEAKPLEAKPAETLEATAPAPPVKPKTAPKKKSAKKQPQRKKVLGADRNTRRGGEKITSATGRSNANGRKNAKSRDGGTKARSNYNGKILSKLRRAKRYPSQARRAGLQGTVTIRFTVSRNGAVSGIRVARSSGHQVLDQAALDMARRAAPMPKFPDDIRDSRLSFTVPVRFSR